MLLLCCLWHVFLKFLLLLLLARLNKKHFAQKHIPEESLVVINLEQVA